MDKVKVLYVAANEGMLHHKLDQKDTLHWEVEGRMV